MKRGLQILLGALSLIPLLVASLGLLFGAGRFVPEEVITPDFDSHYRYITGYYLSLTLFAWWVILNIEKHVVPLRIVSAAIFTGGVGRLISMLEVGLPGSVDIGFTVLELLFPLLLLWQARLPKNSSGRQREHHPTG